MSMNGGRARCPARGVAAGAVLALTMAVVAGVSACGGSASRVRAPSRPGTAQVRVDPGQVFQPVDGFGFAEAFREPVITALPASQQQRLGALLFSPRTGAGMSIVRFGLGGPTDPGDPISGPGDVTDQVWLGKLAEKFGVSQFYADAWSAPAKMKTDGSLDNGGSLCGLPGMKCLSGDSRQAYASYLTAQAKGFAEHGIPLMAVGFVNEPEIGPDYASMQMSPAQAAGFVPFLGRALSAAHLSAKVACCDDVGWTNGAAYTRAVLGDPASARYIGLITSHGYAAAPAVPLTHARHVWESEWSDFGHFDPAWDNGAKGDGLAWAQHIQTALTKADVGAFFYWWGAAPGTDNSALIQLKGSAMHLSKRYWAFAAFGRYIRPGAVRVGATASTAALQVSAFRNRDGSRAVEILNTGTSAERLSLRGLGAGHLAAYVTGDSQALSPQTGPLTVPARSLLTVVVSG
jgi:glucuronoarabinoxylan endo-1,4-beta-xylanase